MNCYLIAYIDPETLTVTGVYPHSEPPWLITRWNGGPLMGVVVEAPGDSYQDALDNARHVYETHEKRLAARFPLPPDSRGMSGTGVTVGS